MSWKEAHKLEFRMTNCVIMCQYISTLKTKHSRGDVKRGPTSLCDVDQPYKSSLVYTWYTRYNAGQLQACVLSGFLQLMAITIITIELHTHGLIHTWFIDVYYIVFFNTKERGGWMVVKMTADVHRQTVSAPGLSHWCSEQYQFVRKRFL